LRRHRDPATCHGRVDATDGPYRYVTVEMPGRSRRLPSQPQTKRSRTTLAPTGRGSHSAVRGIGGASLLADIGRGLPTALLLSVPVCRRLPANGELVADRIHCGRREDAGRQAGERTCAVMLGSWHERQDTRASGSPWLVTG
jgi:hypothetical protein